ncbi:MAG: AMP-binding protein, partial [Deltaproteobacteria bacterium]|nr:AMP-binding protein [Deltaproteobacteria bacterium]
MVKQHPIPIEKLRNWSVKTPDKPAIFRRDEYGWHAFSWSEYYRQSQDVGAALVASGHQPGECIVILSANRAEWLFTQWGIMMAGGVTTPCYMTNTSEQVEYLVGHCGARFVFVENAGQLAKVAAVRGELGKLELAIAFDTEGIDAIDGVSSEWVIGYDEFLARAEEQHHATLDERIAAVERDADAFIIYTSGTTGQPKAVVISHENLAGGGAAILKHYPADDTRVVCYLPLCHIAEQSATNLVQLETGGEVYLCPEFYKLPEYLKDVRPSTMFGVPRVWEKVEATLKSAFEKQTPRKQRMLEWARKIELAATEEKADTGEEPSSFKRWFANKMVLSGIKQKMGIENVEYF